MSLHQFEQGARDTTWHSVAPTIHSIDTCNDSVKDEGKVTQCCSRCARSYSSSETLLQCAAPSPTKEVQSWLVDFDGPDDPLKPINFRQRDKFLIIGLTAACTFCVSFASSIFSTCTKVTAEEFGVSEEVMILGVSLYVLGFAFGPMLWGPLSERFGRFYPIFTGLTLFVICQIPLALAQNLQTVLVSRFLAGLFGAAPLGVTSAIYVDMLHIVDRGVAMSVFAAAVFLGPVLGPIMGSLIVHSHLGWRWTAWVTMIISGVFTLLGMFFVKETSEPIILQKMATKKRLETKEWAWHAKLDESPFTFKAVAQRYLLKPVRIILREPILVAVTAYISLVYSILYAIFFAYPVAFRMIRGWEPVMASLPFLGIMVGIIIACISMGVDARTRYARILKKNGKISPEDRLLPMIVGGFSLPIGLFWFAWTSHPNITFWPQVISGVFIGAGITSVFFNGVIYIADVYLSNVASAIAANGFVRGVSAASVLLFTPYMYRALGVAWATSLLGFFSMAMVPIPIIFYYYGRRLREKGTFSFAL
ncbi:MFS general substrate transporter [Pseudovirgaria hyperparasitica]|uniref:MFS general substrate transporter n=1 Tax=Pseudovirgaria hyperparasitica TaxID=470096 RepID=A0A6A6WE99_9PEZI|nr:MFS general substrate transporter [Pseudovirgaria hyperparasitica]KAF2761152.1 MFS general substrate transporter [Pseudovirgaria hyperparasitica]